MTKLAFGVSIYGNGGMNTAYTTPVPLFSGPTNFRAGVDLQQLFVSPTVAFKANAHNAFGVSLNIAYQKFSAQGLENFANSNFSSAPGNVTERGFSNPFGAGVRVGWLGTINQSLTSSPQAATCPVTGSAIPSPWARLRRACPWEEVSKLRGHNSIKTTEKSYSQWVKTRQDRLNSLVTATWNKQ